NITSGEGGAIVTNSKEISDLLKMLRLHGIDKSAIDRYTKRYEHYDMPVLGWKYNMDNIQAALLIGQLERINSLWQRRDYLWRLYEQELSEIKDLVLLKTIPDSRHARHLFTVLVPKNKRDGILWRLQESGIGVAVNYRPIHLLSFYRKNFGYKEGDFPVAEDMGARTLSLPLYPLLKEEELKRVCSTLKRIMEEV
ncbi:MAG: DegT/DnrJ/EryC1/StrS family aminotransferase, partial [Thermodesulfovibrionales bacterium]|nr:DegT/DnrJ/EryC1/StrS family aminotransferase [Thermodesulfovibrionales bacterium]